MHEATSPRKGFWREAFALHGSITPHVLPNVVLFGLFAAGVCVLSWTLEQRGMERISLEVAPHEIAGAALTLLLILRTNAGYDRWWEARKLWGGIVNQSRNLAISALSYGPPETTWQEKLIRWVAVFPHIARCSLRGQPPSSEVKLLIGADETSCLAQADHMPTFVALRLGDLLREASERLQMDKFAFLQIDRERALLVDHIGACERIKKTPLPLVYSIKIRQAIVLFLLTLPCALLHKMENDWLVPFITMLVAYPLFALDQIGVELQNPFSPANVSHLPLDEIASTIERNLFALLKTKRDTSARVLHAGEAGPEHARR
jgi:putative membrane protein